MLARFVSMGARSTIIARLPMGSSRWLMMPWSYVVREVYGRRRREEVSIV